MKNKILYFILCVFSLGFTTCGDNDGPEPGMIWDFVNYEIEFKVNDTESGEDLLNSETPKNLLDGGVSIIYKDKTYLISDEKSSATKANMPRELALRHYLNRETDSNTLAFGEFSPEKKYKSESFTIKWADGSTDIVKFDLYITWKKGDPTVHKVLYLNNSKVSDTNFPVLTFTKKGI